MNNRNGFLTFKQDISKPMYFSLGTFTFVVAFFLWLFVTSTGLIKPYFLPSPLEIGGSFVALMRDSAFMVDIKDSFYRVTLGYLAAVVLAVPVGILIGSFKTMEALLEPMNDFIRYTPLPAFIPLIILWVGLGNTNQIVVIFLGVFWSLVVMIADAASNVPKELIETAYTLGLNKGKILTKVVFPFSLPAIYDSLRVAIGWAWSSLILAEVVGANTGIGHMITEAQRFLKTPNVICGIIIVGLIGVFFDLLFKYLYPVFFPWSEKV